MWIVAKIYPYSQSERLREYQDILYTMWLSSFIGHIGKHSRFSKPCSLQGYGQRNILIGDYTVIQGNCILGCWEKYGNQSFTPSLTIGSHCRIGEYNHITACNKVIIGDGLLTGRFVYIGDNSHGGLSAKEALISPAERELHSKGEVVIGKNVWIGDKATILPNVHIGDNVIVAASAVVTKNIPNDCIVAGIPAKVVKYI